MHPSINRYLLFFGVIISIATGQGLAQAADGEALSSDDIIFEEDFETGNSPLGNVEIVDVPEPPLSDDQLLVGRMPTVQPLDPVLRNTDIPDGATAVVIRYDCLYASAPADSVPVHYTRQFITFDTTADERHGQDERFYLQHDKAGNWHEVRIAIPIPEGATRLSGGELNNIAEQAPEDYDNPVFFDNLKISFE